MRSWERLQQIDVYKRQTLLFVMAIGGLLLGTVSYMRSASTVEVQNAELKAKEQLWAEQEGLSAEEKWETGRLLLEEQLTDTQISNVFTAVSYTHLSSVIRFLPINPLAPVTKTFIIDSPTLQVHHEYRTGSSTSPSPDPHSSVRYCWS